MVLDHVRRFLRRHDLARPDTRVVVALSGGSDSVALTYLLADLDAASELRLAGIAHFNHQLRPTADRDERFSRSVAETLGRPILIDREDVAARARRDRQSIETAARAARYEFLERARVHFAAQIVAVGHTRDDQAETFLLRLLRGAGPKGLSGIYPRNGTIVRPVLTCRRAELQAYLAARQLAYVDDETNGDVAIPRNRIRAELLPALERAFNPAIVDVLADEAELARGAWEWMSTSASDLYPTIATYDFDRQVSTLDMAALSAVPLALQRLIVWRAMRETAGGHPVSFAHVEDALRLMDSAAPAVVDGPRQRVQRVGGKLVLTGRPSDAVGRPSALRKGPVNFFHYSLSIPGEVVVPEIGCAVSAEPADSASRSPARSAITSNGKTVATAVVRKDLCSGSLTVRNRRPGDRFRPVGLGGQKKLQDFFVDRKVAGALRDNVPVVVDEADRIVWVAGYGIDEAFRVTDDSQAVVILTLRLLGGPA